MSTKLESAKNVEELLQYLEAENNASPLQDASRSRQSLDGFWVQSFKMIPEANSIIEFLSAWHSVLNWLRYDNKPILTCVLSSEGTRTLPLISHVDNKTSFGDMRRSLGHQWLENESKWPYINELPSKIQDEMKCHSVSVSDDFSEDSQSEFSLIYGRDRFTIRAAKSIFSEQYVVAIGKLLCFSQGNDSGNLISKMSLSESSKFELAYSSGKQLSIPGNLIAVFKSQCKKKPQKIAVIDSFREYTYAELDRLSDIWALALSEIGVGAGDNVALAFGRSANMVIAQYAVLKLGGTFVPLDYSLPKARFESMHADANFRCILTENIFEGELSSKAGAIPILMVESIRGSGNIKFNGSGILSSDSAYIIFTSGSTGNPKGVEVSHENLINFVSHFKIEKYVDDMDVCTQFAPFSFDASVAEIHTAILNGKTLLVLSKELIDSPSDLQNYLTRKTCTFAVFPPQYLQQLSPEYLPTLRRLATAGSAPTRDILCKWMPHVNYMNAYGPTETTVLSTAWEAETIPDEHNPISMGNPITNTDVKIINQFGKTLPVGMIGELSISGKGVALGYVNQEELTAEKFILGDDGQRWYSSGDLGCFLDDGQLYFKGRVDDQIKLRGHRLEPGEVESAVSTLVNVDVAAVVVYNVSDQVQLALFLQGTPLTEAEMRRVLIAKIPDWAMPNRIIWQDKLPLTNNGKVDYKRLKATVNSESSVDVVDISYKDELERSVAKIWADVLHRNIIRRDDNFLFLGGDSLTALVVASSLRSKGYSFSSSLLIHQPVFMDFVEAIRNKRKAVDRTYEAEIGSAPLTPIQAWFFQQDLECPQRFCQSLVIEVAEALDVRILTQAVSKLCAYHDILRVSFKEHGNGEWTQNIDSKPSGDVDIKVVTCDETKFGEFSLLEQSSLADDLDIENGPLFRVALLQASKRSRIVFVFHHLLVDTISHSILLSDLQVLYRNPDADIHEVLPGKSLSYFVWSNSLLQDFHNNESLLFEFWKPVIETSKAFPALPLKKGVSGSLQVDIFSFDKPVTDKLLGSATECYRQSPEELLMGAVYLAVSKTFNVSGVGLAVEWHGRDECFAGEQGLDRTTGWFTSIHPLYLDVPTQELSNEELGLFLCALKETRATIPDRGRGFYALQYQSENREIRTNFEGYTGPEIMFNFSGVVQRSADDWEAIPVSAIEMGEGNKNPYCLSVESDIRDGQLSVGLYLDSARWSQQQVTQFKKNLSDSLVRIVSHCSNLENIRRTPSDFPLLSLTNEEVACIPTNVDKAFPLTDMQQTLYRHKEIYQVWMHYEFPHEFQDGAFKAAVQDWVKHNECLRTVIHTWKSGKVAQLVLNEYMPIIASKKVDGASRTPAVEMEIAAQKERVIEFDALPPYGLQVYSSDTNNFSVLLSIHHIIHDGWTIELLIDSLNRFYSKHLGATVELPKKSSACMQDMVQAQLYTANATDCNAYWDSISWADNYCLLPKRVNADQVKGRQIELLLAELPNDVVASARIQAKQQGVTLNCVFLSAFVCLLRYLGGAHQVRCGVIQSGRPEALFDVDKITGCCVNTLPLVVDFEHTQSLESIINGVHSQLLTLKDSATYPLSKIYKKLKSNIDGDIFDCLFNIESSDYCLSPGEERPKLIGGYESTNYNFIFGLIEKTNAQSEKDYGLRLGFDNSRYTQDMVNSWVDIYVNILTIIGSKSDQSWSQVKPLPAQDMSRVLQWNDTTTNYPSETLLADHFENSVRCSPNKTALAFKNIKITYAELDERTDRLSRLLASKGVGSEVVVGLVSERSLEMVYGILSIIRAGGAYVPIDPKYPEDRVTHMLEELNCSLILLQKAEFSSVIPKGLEAEKIVIQDGIQTDVSDLPKVDKRSQHTRQLAYVMYTSGSTGKPKGVMIEQRSIIRLIKNSKDIQFAQDDCILITSAPGFDVTTYELWSALLNGLTLAVIDEDTLLDPVSLSREIIDKQVTFLWVVSPLFNQLIQEKPDLFAPVKRIMIGGDALSPYHINLTRSNCPNLVFINGYGPTENTSFSTYHFLSEDDSEIIPIGRPVTNSTCYIVNPDGHLLPPGVKGELCVGGHGVARGYYNRPELTAEQFYNNPFSDPEDILYRTGDLVSWRMDGLIDFHGRIDFQIKIRGFRVELGEIESVILRVAAVKQAIVLAKNNGNQKRLSAYVVQDCALDVNSSEQFIETLKASLSDELPDYMVPESIILLEAMPLNENGKIDRPRLPDPVYTDGNISRVAPKTDTEKALWEIWKEVLKIDNFGVTDNFYMIGGDSIIAIQVVSSALKCGLKLSTRSLNEHKNIRGLSQLLEEQNNQSGRKVELRAPESVSGEQRMLPIHLHFLSSDSVDQHHYNQSALVRLPLGVTQAHLLCVFQALVDRHDAFRLRFRNSPNGWMARYNNEFIEYPEQLGSWLQELDLSQETPEDAEHLLESALLKLQSGLDLKSGDVCRWLLVRDEHSDRLYWVMHHLIVDGISWRILTNDFEMSLSAICNNRAVEIDNKTSSYQSWASKLYEYANSEEIQIQKDWWIQQLLMDSSVLPFDDTSAKRRLEADTAIIEISLSVSDTENLLHRSNQCYQTSINDLLLSALSIALDTWANTQNLRVYMEGHGREELFEDIDLSQTVGWFTTLFPVNVTRINGDIGQQILHIKQTLESIPNKGLGYGVLRYLTQDEELLDLLEEIPEPDLVFNYLGQMDEQAGNQVDELRVEMSTAGGTVSGKRQRMHALGVNGYVKDGVLRFNVDYHREQFRPSTISNFTKYFRSALIDVIKHCIGFDSDKSIPKFDFLSVSREQTETLQATYPTLSDAYPITPMQQGLVLYTQRDNSGAYLTQIRMTIDALDIYRFKKAWEILVARYDIFRTAFVDLGQHNLSQVVSQSVPLNWQELTFSGDDLALDRALNEERVKPFDTTQAPLMRFLILHLDEDQSIFSWTHHHALLDGWSMSIVIQDLIKTYTQLLGGKAVSSYSAPSYKNYIHWLNDRNLKDAEVFWKSQLAGVESADHLPQAKKDIDDNQKGEQRLTTTVLDEPLSRSLQKLARASGFTLSAFIQTAWALLLSKYTGEQDVVFGYAISGRPADLDGVERMVGLFINSLPMRVSLGTGDSLAASIEKIQKQQMDADEHNYVALADIQKWAGLRADTRLFESLVVLENYPLDPSTLNSDTPGTLKILDIQGVEQNDFALNLVVYPGDTMAIKLVYLSGFYDDSTAKTMLAHFCKLLSGMVVRSTSELSQTRLCDLPLLNDEEIQRAVFEWNNSALDIPNTGTIYELIYAQAIDTPKKVALVMDEQSWTYKELLSKVDVYSRWLQSEGVISGDLVAISLPKSPELIACILGTIKLAAAYIPVALDCPKDRLEFIASDANIRALISNSVEKERFKNVEFKVLYCDTLDVKEWQHEKLIGPTIIENTAHHLAYIIYTSGTTGQPKGVAISHKNLINFCFWCRYDSWLKPGERAAQFAPFTFDASVGESFGALMNGAELHLLSESLIENPADVVDYLNRHHIVFTAFPPSYLQQIQTKNLPKGMTLLTAGAAPPIEKVSEWGEQCRYINAYGPTETTILSSVWHYNRETILHGKLPIGRPICNTQMYVVDQYGQLCPPGISGEIYIGGAGVARQYLNNDELTDRQFISDPWRQRNRLYRSGDLGRWLQDGTIEFAGRRDHQVKIRGFRIELSGIEFQLRQQPEVEQACVLAKTVGADKQLLAWIVPKPEVAHSNAVDLVAELRSELRKKLAHYMIPQGFMVVSELPVTANGKIDTKALLTANIDPIYEGGYVAPQGEFQCALTKIWATLLHIDPKKLSTTANFFDIGGHSLLATRMVTEIANQLGVKIEIRDVFEMSNIAKLAELIGSGTTPDALDSISVIDRNKHLPASFSQQRLWFIDQLESGSAQYNQPLFLRLEGCIKIHALQKALDSVVERHEVLRTRFITESGEPHLQIDPTSSVPVKIFDISSISQKEKLVEEGKIIQEEIGIPFNLQDGLKLRTTLIIKSEIESILAITLHHIASDGWSFSLLIEEISALYQEFVTGEVSCLPVLKIQYTDYAAWQRNTLQGKSLEVLSDYWKVQLADLPPAHKIPLDFPRPSTQSYSGEVFVQHIGPELTVALRQLAQKHNTTLFMALQACFSVLFSRYSGEEDIAIGTPIANREQPEVAPLIGFFVNTLVLRNQVSMDMRFDEVLLHCREVALDAYAHQQMPFDLLVEELQPERSLSYNPLFQVMFALENIDSRRKIQLPDLTLAAMENPVQVMAQFDLSLDIAEGNDQLEAVWSYASDLFKASTVERMAGHFEKLLKSVCEHPGCTIGKLPMISSDEKRQLLQEFNLPLQPELFSHSWPELFKSQVLKSPDSIVAVCESQSLTFSDLDRLSLNLAKAFNAMGVGQDCIVGLLEDRGIDLLVMIVAVLRAGAAYLPLDPTQPKNRWLEILNDSSPDLLVVGDNYADQVLWLESSWINPRLATLTEVRNYEYDSTRELQDVALTDLAYVIFTSGSTGKPKGVMIEHQGMINNMLSKVKPLGLSDNDVIAQTASQCFDISVWQFLTAPIIGATVVIFTNETTRDPQALAELLYRHSVSIWEPVPSVIQSILPLGRDLPSLRWVLPTGEALMSGLVERWFRQYPRVPLMNAYGPAECSDDVSFQPIYGPVECVLIGKPVANARLHVVDRDLNLLSIGIIGELAISGPVVGRGYLHREDLTHEAFKINPYTLDKWDNRLYLTGDLVKRHEDGSLEYIGRKDSQVKIRGFRIELGEIESRFSQYPAVKEAVVKVVSVDDDDKRLIAYVVIDPSAKVTVEDLRESIRSELPEYMVPTWLVSLDSIPLTANGKVDTKSLPEPDTSHLHTENYVAPEGDIEHLLAQCWQSVLNVERVGRRDNFFNMGGHSLLVMKLMELLRNQGLNMNVRSIFETEDLAELAESLTRQTDNDLFVAPPNKIPEGCERITPNMLPLIALTDDQITLIANQVPGGHSNIQDIYPLTPLQEGILFDHLVSEVGDTYLASILLGFETKEILDRYLSALRQLIGRHDSLRTAILWEDLPRAIQVVYKNAELETINVDLNPNRDAVEQFEEMMGLEGRHIDLRKAPIVGLMIAKNPENGMWLVLQQQHHLICDQVSMEIEFGDIVAFWNNKGESLEPPVPYREFVAHTMHRAETCDAQEYFRKSLAGVDEPTAPFGLMDIYRGGKSTTEFEYTLAPELTQRLRRSAYTLGASPAAIFHLAWGLVLARCCNRDDVVFGTVTSGRLQGTNGADRIFGLFINMLPFRLPMAHLSVADALTFTREKLVELLNYEQAPLVEVQRCSELPGSTPLFSAILNFRHDANRKVDLENVIEGVKLLKAPGDISNYLFDMSVSDEGTGFTLTASIDESIGSERIMGYMCRALNEISRALDDAPETHLLSLPVLSDKEQAQLLSEFNYPFQRNLFSSPWTDLFSDQVAKTPNKIVAECNGDSLTFSELDKKSDNLAKRIIIKGIGKGCIVGLLDNRGLDLLTMIVGVLKSGAAYLPLDPTQPTKRWLEILRDSKPDLLLVGNSFDEEICWLKGEWTAEIIITLNDTEQVVLDDQIELPDIELRDLAYVIFTSGSTGKPKGVMIEHMGMVNNMLTKVAPLGLTEGDVIAQTASQCFDISVWQFLTAPILGAKVVIVDNETTRDAQALVECLSRNGVTIWEPVPSVIQALLPLAHPLPTMRWVLPTGEALVSGLVDRWFKQYPNVPMMNAYGPAECSDDVAFQPITGPVERVYIGKPVPNAKLHVVDRHLALLPVGVIGELAISGPVVGRGYLHRPELTDEVFRANPYAQDELDTRLYLTGDLVKRHEDGNLEYIGRKDFQVKVRGFRIELGEIESRLSQHPGVKEVVVAALANAQGDKYLVAYVIFEGNTFSKEQLSDYLAAELPDYMLPSIYVTLDAMPLNNNGKIDRKSLPEPEISSAQMHEFEKPESEIEIKMAQTWQEILNLEKVGRNDNFFDLGGNSILIIRLLSELKAKGIELHANDIYTHRVLKDCCARVRKSGQSLKIWLDTNGGSFVWSEFKWQGQILKSLILCEPLKAKEAELRIILAAEEEDLIPDYVAYADKPEELSKRLQKRGLRAMPKWKLTSARDVKRSLNEQMNVFESSLISGKVETRFPYSPMQKELLQWKTRDDFEWVSVRGYFTPQHLQKAFYKLMCEQDMLRVLSDEGSQEWLLVDKSALSGNFPWVDLSGYSAGKAEKLMKLLFRQLRQKQCKSTLPYMGVWIKRSDTLHQLIMMDDHMISDGSSSAFIQRRLDELVKDRALGVHHCYRDYIREVWKNTGDETCTAVIENLELVKTVACVKPTNQRLTARENKKLRSRLIKVPMKDGEAAVDQAFNWFKKLVFDVLNVKQFVMVMNHYGRQLNDTTYFDQVGLFMDKIPLLVNGDTQLQQLSNKIEYLVKNSINFMALEKSGNEIIQQSFPGLSHEILFNYEGEIGEHDVMHEILSEQKSEEKLKQYCGILFEAYSLNSDLIIHCAFRGSSDDEERLLKVIPGENFNPTSVSRNTHKSNDESISVIQNEGLSSNKGENMKYSIEVNDVRKHYGSFEAVKGVSFKVEQGICFGILGPNGAGKTSLLSMIEGISKITSGSISVLDMDVATKIKKIQPHVGVQLQQNNYFEFLTVDQLLRFYKELRSANNRNVSGESVDELLDRLNLSDKKKFKVDELSGGQKQRLSIAIALLEDPDILFLDEPTSALDPHSRHDVWKFIEHLKKDKSKTIILTTHYMEEAETLCDEIMIMSDGKIISQGTPSDLINTLSPHHDIHLQFGRGEFETDCLVELSGIIDYQWESQAKQLTIKTEKFTETLKEILDISETKRLEIVNFNINRPNLEDVFLSSTKKELVE